MLELTQRIVDLARGRVISADGDTALTTREAKLLEVLAATPGKSVSRDDLLVAWGYARTSTSRTVDTHVMTLRKKIELDPRNPQHLITVQGEGYKLVLEVEHDPGHAPSQDKGSNTLHIPGGFVDFESGQVHKQGGVQRLTRTELRLLSHLAERADSPVSRDALSWALWRKKGKSGLDQTLRRLRLKVERDPDNPEVVVTERGAGIKLVTSSPPVFGYSTEFFVGRQGILEQLETSITEHKLTVIFGAGGMGKTQLAQRVAGQSRRGFVQPPAWADLTTVEDVESALAVIARALDAPNATQASIQQTLNHVHRLVVLDNIEPVAEQLTPLLAMWLQGRSPILCTSRVRIALQGAHNMPLGPLSAGDAADLFRHHARKVRSDVDLSDEGAVTRIVEELGAHPLALELAAAHLHRHTLSEIVHLTSVSGLSARDARPERHQSLERVFQETWADLPPEDRVALGGLAVFAGGFNLDGAAAVLGEQAGTRIDHLMDRGLVHWFVTHPGLGRFSMLPTVREFALTHATQSQHRDHALFLAQMGASPELLFDQVQCDLHGLLRVELEIPNLWAAFYWLRSAGELERAGHVVLVLGGVLQHQGPYDTVVNALRHLREELDPGPTWARVSGELASYEIRLGQADVARELAAVALEIGVPAYTWSALHLLLAQSLRSRGNLGAALEEARLTLDGTDPSSRLYPSAVNTLAGIHIAMGDLPEAERVAEPAFAAAQKLGDSSAALRAKAIRAHLVAHRGRLQQARLLYHEVLQEHENDHRHRAIAEELLGLAHLNLFMGNLEEARAQFEKADGMATHWNPDNPLFSMARYMALAVAWEQNDRVLTPELTLRLEAALAGGTPYVSMTLRRYFAEKLSWCGEHERAMELMADLVLPDSAWAFTKSLEGPILARAGHQPDLPQLLEAEAAGIRQTGWAGVPSYLCRTAETAILVGQPELAEPRLKQASERIKALGLSERSPVVRELRHVQTLLRSVS